MLKKQNEQIPFFLFEHLASFSKIKHFVSSRQGGVSIPPFDQLNLSFKHDDPSDVLQNRRILSEAVEIPLEYFCFAQQTHGNEVYVVGNQDRGRGAFNRQSEIPQVDALVTNSKDICLVVTSADCVPLLFFDPNCEVIAAAHSGWRGTVQKITTKTIQVMIDRFGSHPNDILVGIGPCIGVDRYEVGEEVIAEVDAAYTQADDLLPFYENTQKRHFDLIQANIRQLKELQIPLKNVEIAHICTYDQSDVFFSYRREQNKVGIFGSGIMLKGK